jgi:hypothetical protein
MKGNRGARFPGRLENEINRGKLKSSWTGSSMVEQLTLNQRVVGSSPTRFTIDLKRFAPEYLEPLKALSVGL